MTSVREIDCEVRRKDCRVARRWAIGIVVAIGLAVTSGWVFLTERVTRVETKVEAQQDILQEIKRDVKDILKNGGGSAP